MPQPELDHLFAGAIPQIYDRYLTPLIFDGYALDLVARVQAAPATRILEVAAGTGVVSRSLAPAIPDAQIVATDLNQPMLDYAATQFEAIHPDATNLRWQQADAMALPFPDASFDTVVCQFSVMFFPDRVAAYREALRVLTPGGRFIFNAWDRIEDNEVTLAVSDAVAALFPEDPPNFLPRTPHGYHDVDQIRRDVTAAGFISDGPEAVDLETIAMRSRAPSPRDPAIAYCAGTPLRNEIEARDPDRLEEAIEAAT
ncbi:MAG: class I SAM-dependent methyltransferase, partial [Rhodospirillaceae bacterium]|nr:class I SAM-dependent methyltransferase [Rhodospirillaceae bacterium]